MDWQTVVAALFPQGEEIRQNGDLLYGSGRCGNQSFAVRILQRSLNTNHCYDAGLQVDGIYGNLTAAAVRAVQGALHIAQDGVYGPQTRSHMLWRTLGADHPMEAHKVDSRIIWERGRTADAREGVTSFLEKRPAEFPMKVSADMGSFFPWWQERKFE